MIQRRPNATIGEHAMQPIQCKTFKILTTIMTFAICLLFATVAISCDESATDAANVAVQKSDISPAASKIAGAYPKKNAASEGETVKMDFKINSSNVFSITSNSIWQVRHTADYNTWTDNDDPVTYDFCGTYLTKKLTNGDDVKICRIDRFDSDEDFDGGWSKYDDYNDINFPGMFSGYLRVLNLIEGLADDATIKDNTASFGNIYMCRESDEFWTTYTPIASAEKPTPSGNKTYRKVDITITFDENKKLKSLEAKEKDINSDELLKTVEISFSYPSNAKISDYNIDETKLPSATSNNNNNNGGEGDQKGASVTKTEWTNAFEAINSAKPDPSSATAGQTACTSFSVKNDDDFDLFFNIFSNKKWQIRFTADFNEWCDEFDTHTYDGYDEDFNPKHYENEPYSYCGTYLMKTKNGKCYRVDRWNADEEFELYDGKWTECDAFEDVPFAGIVEGYVRAIADLEDKFDSAVFDEDSGKYDISLYFTRSIYFEETSDYFVQDSKPTEAETQWHKAEMLVKFDPTSKKLAEIVSQEFEPDGTEPFRVLKLDFSLSDNSEISDFVVIANAPEL